MTRTPMPHTNKTFANVAALFLLTIFLMSVAMVGCAKLNLQQEFNFKCSYTYDQVTGCSAAGYDMTSKQTGTEVVQATDETHACVLIAEYNYMDHGLSRLHLICDPTSCQNLGAVPAPTMPGPTPMGVDAGVMFVDAGSADAGPPDITCPKGEMPVATNCPAVMAAAEQASTSPLGDACLNCIALHCCPQFTMAYNANPNAVPTEPSAVLTDFGCWLNGTSCEGMPQDQDSNLFQGCVTGNCAASGACLISGP